MSLKLIPSFFVSSFVVVSTATFAQPASIDEEMLVVGTTPGSGLGQIVNDLPFDVKSVNAADLRDAQSLDLTDYMNMYLGSVSINSAQNNPLQPDVQFRGFTASPLLGLPQGISVYQNGVRINEPLGDAVNWDLLPESAVQSIDLISGANPLFGLNTLGGALNINMKNGFNFEGNALEVSSGSWGRTTATFESGGNFNSEGVGSWGYYVNINTFDEEGWRDLSESEATNFYGSVNWRNGDISALNFNYQQGDSELRGNGAAPIGLLAIDRSQIFTAPDITENNLKMFSVDGSHFINDNLQIAATLFRRKNDTDSFNGDGSEFELCNYFGGAQSMFEEADDIEDALEDDLNIELDDICEGGDPSITNYDELENYIEDEALANGFDPENYELEDVADDISGTGILSDEAINNISNRVQESQGFDGKVNLLSDLFKKENRLTLGFSYFEGDSTFDSILELSELDPITRSTAGLGTGAFFDEAETSVKTKTETSSVYFFNTMHMNAQWALTVGGRYNDSDITLRDQSGERPELNGDHNFSRFNPTVGFTFNQNDNHANNTVNWYGSYSESNRVPTPIELACNEGVFEIAQQIAIENGEDPDDIEFECRLPNAFLADPPLDDVVTKSIEFGMRGALTLKNKDNVKYHVGVFRTINYDDILFQTTGRATGLFANVDKTQRLGLEVNATGRFNKLTWFANYSYVEATFGDDFEALSPNHPSTNDEGSIHVNSGDRIPGIPEHLLKIGGDYFFTDNFSIGADAMYNSDQYLRGDESNELDTVAGYAVFNLRANYNISSNFSVFARVTNVFDEEYENFGLLGEDPSEILELDDSRPVFLGAGAPRAAWVGVRFSF